MCRRIPYCYSYDELRPAKLDDGKADFVKKKQQFIVDVNRLIKAGIGSKKLPEKIIYDVLDVACDYDKLFKNNQKFTFSLVQKWVNMTYKYLWLFDRCPIEEELLHVTMDRYFIYAMTSSCDSNTALGISASELKPDLSWSRFSVDENTELYFNI